MEPLKSWEREGKIVWNPASGLFRDTWVSSDIRGPMYYVVVRLDLPEGSVRIVREQRALIPSLAEKRVRDHYLNYFPERCIQVVLVRRGRTQWKGWTALDKSQGYPIVRDTRQTTNGR